MYSTYVCECGQKVLNIEALIPRDTARHRHETLTTSEAANPRTLDVPVHFCLQNFAPREHRHTRLLRYHAVHSKTELTLEQKATPVHPPVRPLVPSNVISLRSSTVCEKNCQIS